MAQSAGANEEPAEHIEPVVPDTAEEINAQEQTAPEEPSEKETANAALAEKLVENFYRCFKTLVQYLSNESDHLPASPEVRVFVTKLVTEIYEAKKIDLYGLSRFAGYMIALGIRGRRLERLYLDEFNDARKFYDHFDPSDSKLVKTMLSKDEWLKLRDLPGIPLKYAIAKCIARVRGGDLCAHTLMHSILVDEYGPKRVFELSSTGDVATVLEAAEDCKFVNLQQGFSDEQFQGNNILLYQTIEILVERHVYALRQITSIQNERRCSGIRSSLMRLMVKSDVIKSDFDQLATIDAPSVSDEDQSIPSAHDVHFIYCAYLLEVYEYLNARSVLMTGEMWPEVKDAPNLLDQMSYDEGYMKRAFVISKLCLFDVEMWKTLLQYFGSISKVPSSYIYFHATLMAFLDSRSGFDETTSPVLSSIRTLADQHSPNFEGSIEPKFKENGTVDLPTRRAYIATHVTNLILMMPDIVIHLLIEKNNTRQLYEQWMKYYAKHALHLHQYNQEIVKLEVEAIKLIEVGASEIEKQDRKALESKGSQSSSSSDNDLDGQQQQQQ